MTEATSQQNSPSLPKPIVKKTWWPFPLVWIVPLAAAVAAGFYFRDRLNDHGPEVTVEFTDASGLKAGETAVSHLGVEVGKVISIDLNRDQRKALVRVRLRREDNAFAKSGALYWIVRPEISPENISGLETITSGPYIDATPGEGDPTATFTGLQKMPVSMGKGLNVVLHAPRLERLQAGSPAYYRGVQVGTIRQVQLSADATGVDVHLFIPQRFTPLVRTNSRFWILQGADLKGGLLSGVQLKIDSLRALISGGIAFATPDEKIGPLAKDGANFPLYGEPKQDWIDWSPHIEIPPAESFDEGPKGIDVPQAPESARSAVR